MNPVKHPMSITKITIGEHKQHTASNNQEENNWNKLIGVVNYGLLEKDAFVQALRRNNGIPRRIQMQVEYGYSISIFLCLEENQIPKLRTLCLQSGSTSKTQTKETKL